MIDPGNKMKALVVVVVATLSVTGYCYIHFKETQGLETAVPSNGAHVDAAGAIDSGGQTGGDPARLSEKGKALVRSGAESGAEVEKKELREREALLANKHKLPLLEFISRGETELFFEYIHANQVDINAPLNAHGMRLIELLLKRDLEAARRLYDLGARLDFPDRNILLKVAGVGEAEAVAFLLETGLFDLGNGVGEAALHWAAMFGKTDTIHLLVDAGAVFTPERYAERYGDGNPLDQLSRSAKTNGESLTFFMDRGFEPNETHLVNAIRTANLDALASLVAGGANLGKVKEDGGNAMDLAVQTSRTNVALVKYMEANGFEVKPHHLEIAENNVAYERVVSEVHPTANGGLAVMYSSHIPHARAVRDYISSRL